MRPTLYNVAGSVVTRPLCRHCGLRRGYTRGLCNPCHDDKGIRVRYSCLPTARAKRGVCAKCQVRDEERNGLCLGCLIQPCPHGQADGCCAVCERALRQQLGISTPDQEDED